MVFTRRTQEEKTLLIDIGTATVSGAVMTEGKGGAPRLHSVMRTPLVSGSETARAALSGRLEPALAELLGKFSKETPKRVRVVLASPWYEAAIRTITSRSEKEVSISDRSVLKAVEQYKNEKPPRSGNVDIEALAVQVQVNGYHSHLVKSVTGKDIAINFYESETDSETEKHLRRAIEKIFPHAHISYHTFPLVASVALRSLLNETSFAFVDVAGEMTEIAIIYEDGIHHLSSIPIGYYTIARAFGSKKSAVADSLSKLALYGREELSSVETGKAAEGFEKAFVPWREAFEKALRAASETVPIPQKLFLVTDREQMLWLKKGIVAKNPFSLSVVEVNAPLIQNAVELGEAASYDPFLALSALFFHTYHRALIGE